jgi:hypothetical protein
MDHTGRAIRDAAEKGGYGYRWWKANDLEDDDGYNALPMRALTEHLQDPEFWKGLGRARDWEDTGAWLFHSEKKLRASSQAFRQRGPNGDCSSFDCRKASDPALHALEDNPPAQRAGRAMPHTPEADQSPPGS